MATQPVLTPKPDQAAIPTSRPIVMRPLYPTRPAIPPVNNASGDGLTTGYPVSG